jgi:hypothetical protein
MWRYGLPLRDYAITLFGHTTLGSTTLARERPKTHALGYGYTGTRTDTTQQSGQTPDKVKIKNITVYVSGYTETDTTGLLSSPTVWSFSVAVDKQ